MQKVEEELVFEELKILREIAMECYETEKKMEQVYSPFFQVFFYEETILISMSCCSCCKETTLVFQWRTYRLIYNKLKDSISLL